MDNIVETYGSIPIYKEGDYFYILCRDRNGEEHKIHSMYLPVLKRKITQSFKYDNLKWNGQYVYIYF